MVRDQPVPVPRDQPVRVGEQAQPAGPVRALPAQRVASPGRRRAAPRSTPRTRRRRSGRPARRGRSRSGRGCRPAARSRCAGRRRGGRSPRCPAAAARTSARPRPAAGAKPYWASWNIRSIVATVTSASSVTQCGASGYSPHSPSRYDSTSRLRSSMPNARGRAGEADVLQVAQQGVHGGRPRAGVAPDGVADPDHGADVATVQRDLLRGHVRSPQASAPRGAGHATRRRAIVVVTRGYASGRAARCRAARRRTAPGRTGPGRRRPRRARPA